MRKGKHGFRIKLPDGREVVRFRECSLDALIVTAAQFEVSIYSCRVYTLKPRIDITSACHIFMRKENVPEWEFYERPDPNAHSWGNWPRPFDLKDWEERIREFARFHGLTRAVARAAATREPDYSAVEP